MPSASTTSTARMYFEQIQNHPAPYSYVSGFISPQRPAPFFEEEWIDFKGNPNNDKDAKKIWSKALSGFANITDGLIVWGVDARKTPPRDIDAASGLRLIPDPHVLESNLRDWIRDATNPPVMGVEYVSILGPTGEGFVVCLVPESTHKPHRAEFADKHYYYRAGDDFLMAELGLLKALFYPQSSPFIWVRIELKYLWNDMPVLESFKSYPTSEILERLIKTESKMRVAVQMQNDGTVSAKDVYIALQTQERISHYTNANWEKIQNRDGDFAFYAKRPIHPGESIEVFAGPIEKQFQNQERETRDWEVVPVFDTIQFDFSVYAEGIQGSKLSARFTPNDFDWQTCSAIQELKPR